VIVVSNASPIRYFVLIDAIDALPQRFGEVVIPPIVQQELCHIRTPIPVRNWISAPPDWLRIQAPTLVDPSLKVHAGEDQAILLAKELGATRLLIDDQAAIQAARERGVRTTRMLAVLILAAEQKLIDLELALSRLKLTNFRVPPELLDQILDEFRSDQLS